MSNSRPIEPSNGFQERLAAFAEQKRRQALSMPPGPDRNEMLNRARRADDAAHVDDWARSLFSQLK